MRLTRPTLATPLVITAEAERDVVKDTLNNELRADPNSLAGLEHLCLGQTLTLPQSFGYVSVFPISPRKCGTKIDAHL